MLCQFGLDAPETLHQGMIRDEPGAAALPPCRCPDARMNAVMAWIEKEGEEEGHLT